MTESVGSQLEAIPQAYGPGMAEPSMRRAARRLLRPRSPRLDCRAIQPQTSRAISPAGPMLTTKPADPRHGGLQATVRRWGMCVS